MITPDKSLQTTAETVISPNVSNDTDEPNQTLAELAVLVTDSPVVSDADNLNVIEKHNQENIIVPIMPLV